MSGDEDSSQIAIHDADVGIMKEDWPTLQISDPIVMSRHAVDLGHVSFRFDVQAVF